MARHDYRFFSKEKDPVIDLMRTEAQRQGFKGDFARGQIERLSRLSGVSSGAIRNWFFGETHRPQSLSSRFVMQALGINVKYFRDDGVEIGGNSMRISLMPEAKKKG